jgi:hypothetical protein
MLRAIIRQIGKYLIALSANDALAKTASAGSENRARSDFGRQTRQLAQARKATAKDGKPTSIVAGSIQFVGMEDIKRSLGARWPAVQNIAYAIAEDSIRKHLTGLDAFGRHDAETFILSFATANKAEAEAKTRAIVEEMRSLLAERAPDAGLGVDHTVADVEWVDGEPESVIDSIAKVLRKVKEEAQASATALRNQFVRNIVIRYSPIWTPARRVVLSYRVSIDSETGRHAFQRLTEVSTPEELKLVMFDLDCAIIGRAVAALHKLLVRSGRAQFMIPVNFSTLDDRARRERYMNLCHEVPPHYKKFLIFLLQGVPAGITATRLCEIARTLQAHGQGVLVEFPVQPGQAFDFIGSSFHGIAINARSLPVPVGEATQRLTRLALIARAAGLKVFLLGADTAGSVEAAVAAQVDCVEGRAIALPSNGPKSAYQWSPLASPGGHFS